MKHGTEREMRTVACALDFLLEGDLVRCGDVLLGRYKALEEATHTGSWEVASEREAVPSRDMTLTSESERGRAAALQMRKVRLQTTMSALRRPDSG